MADERWKSEDAEMQVGKMEGGQKDYKELGYGGFSKDYEPIPPEKVRPETNLESPKMKERKYPLNWKEEDWVDLENHYMAQIEQIMTSWEDDTYTGWAVWMELTKLMILLLNELGLSRLCRMFFLTLFEEDGPRIEAFRFNLYMPKSEQEEYERHQDRKGKSYDRTVESWSSEEGEEEEKPEEMGVEKGRHFWSPRPEAVEETG